MAKQHKQRLRGQSEGGGPGILISQCCWLMQYEGGRAQTTKILKGDGIPLLGIPTMHWMVIEIYISEILLRKHGD